MIDTFDLTAPSDNRDRRSGQDRRLLCYDLYIPERRFGNDRRKGADRRKRNTSSMKLADTTKKK